jgi:hypothetical protein
MNIHMNEFHSVGICDNVLKTHLTHINALMNKVWTFKWINVTWISHLLINLCQMCFQCIISMCETYKLRMNKFWTISITKSWDVKFVIIFFVIMWSGCHLFLRGKGVYWIVCHWLTPLNKHTLMNWYLKNLCILLNEKPKVKSYEPSHVC